MSNPTPNKPRHLLVLDLDETLIHASETSLHRAADHMVYGYHVYRRPHLDVFLASCFEHYSVGIWSSASDEYVEAVAKLIVPDPGRLEFIWGRSKASFSRVRREDDDYTFFDPWNHRHYLKPLAKLKRFGWTLDQMLIVDDTPEKCVRNYGNAIYPREYDGRDADDELLLLARYLERLKDAPNLRQLEKRRWRAEIEQD
ncbi:HAD family hydrolase [Sphingopyxis sp. KK2]|uniref:HAD family hydrolase n=1 Tax=Sphingopyxis sp. KK2 TaxID=1855727 RepID=UPI00097E64F8|nr:HAD family hydrolase [Sphingopyxis sp. KK2]